MTTTDRAARRAREREVWAKRVALEEAILADLKAGQSKAQVARARALPVARVEAIRARLLAEGDLQPAYRPGREPGAVDHQEADALARAELRRWGICYRDCRESLHNPVRAMRNGMAVRMVPVGGSVAGSCAEIGSAA